MLVAAHSGSFAALESIILHRNIKAIVANLSAIESIEPWDEERKIPGGREALFAASNILIRLFQYSVEDATDSNHENVLDILDDNEVEYITIRQRRGPPLIRVVDISEHDESVLEALIEHPGVRTLIPEPKYSAFPVSASSAGIVRDAFLIEDRHTHAPCPSRRSRARRPQRLPALRCRPP